MDLKLNPFRLAFVEEQAALEEDFQNDYFTNNLSLFRICHFFAIFFYCIFGVLDVVLFPEQKNIANILQTYDSHK